MSVRERNGSGIESGTRRTMFELLELDLPRILTFISPMLFVFFGFLTGAASL